MHFSWAPGSRQQDAAKTASKIIDSVKKAANDKTGYFSSRECLRQLGSNLASIKTEIAKDGMVKHIATPIRDEIDRVLQVVNDVLLHEDS